MSISALVGTLKWGHWCWSSRDSSWDRACDVALLFLPWYLDSFRPSHIRHHLSLTRKVDWFETIHSVQSFLWISVWCCDIWLFRFLDDWKFCYATVSASFVDDNFYFGFWTEHLLAIYWCVLLARRHEKLGIYHDLSICCSRAECLLPDCGFVFLSIGLNIKWAFLVVTQWF